MTPKTSRSDYPDRDPDLFYELARDRLSMQLETVDALDNKIGLLVTLAGGLMGILAAVFALRGEPLDGGDIALIVLSTGAYLTASGLGIKAYFCRRWELGPDLGQVWESHWGKDSDSLLKWKVAISLWSNYEANHPGHQTKAEAVPWVLTAVVIQTLLLALALFLVAEGA